ncbi:MAG: RluA family pseudouridine synthase [Oscillospiraceae bacterium]|nr:RluA family pseudouridine synthase [Oscillospiraceae bacterium]
MTKIIACERDGARLDAFLAESLPELSRSFIAGLIDSGSVTLRGKKLKKSYKTAAGDDFALDLPEPHKLEVGAEDIPLDIVYEDNDVIVVNKPKGMVVHPAPGHSGGTLVNALLNHCGDSLSGINGVIRPGIVHRIDKDTSGLVIAAKNDAAHKFLADQLKDHSLSRVYEAVLVGNLREDSGTVDAPIGRHPTDRKKQAVTVKNSREAITHWEVIARYPGFTHARMRLETGRTHQIRVHMAHIGHPVLGDTVYGSKKPVPGLEGQCLHAKKLRFIHPATKEPVELECDLPEYFIKVLKSLK